MAKQGKTRPARRRRGDDSLLMQSAKSLGRIIRTLQRQLEKAVPPATAADDSSDRMPTMIRATRKTSGARKAKTKTSAARASTRASTSAARKKR
jgi:hypothetical protein